MGLFDSIRRVVGGGGESTDADEPATDGELIDTRELDVPALRQEAEGVASEVEQLDFSLESLESFDAAIEAGYDEELTTTEDPETYARDVVRFGCYLGEVLVRVYGGRWERDPEWGVTVPGPDDEVTVAVFRVATRSITDEPVFAAVAERVATDLDVEPTDGAPVTPEPVTDEDAGDDGGTDAEPAADEASARASDSDADADTEDVTSDDASVEADDDVPRDAADGASGGPGRPTEPDAFKSGFGTVEESDDSGTGDAETAPSDGAATGQSGAESGETVGDGPDEGAGDEPAEATGDAGPPDGGAVETADSASDDSDDVSALVEEAEPDADDDSPWFEEAEPDATAGDETTDTDTTAEDGTTDPDEPVNSAAETEATDPKSGTDADETESLFSGAGEESDPMPEPTEEDGPLPPAESDTESTAADGAAESSPLPDRESGADDGPAGVDPAEGEDLRAEYAEQAESFVSFWNERDLDYTPASLERLDELVAAEWDDDRFDDATLGSDETFDDRAFTSVTTELGSYFGEVLVRELDAEWSDETANDSVIVDGADGQLAIPVFRVAETSLRKGPVFARSYDSLLEDLGNGD